MQPACIRKMRPGRHRKSSTSGDPPRITTEPRHYRYIVVLAVVVITCFYLFSAPAKQAVTDIHLFHHTPTHKPQPQKNSTSGDVHWFSDLKWLKPFSSSITLDDDRSLLPPLTSRPHIYTYYNAQAEKDEKIRTAESQLLLIWRRAWWAQGFRPVVLGPSEAKNHYRYDSVKSKTLAPQLEADLMRWLAWGHMGKGILANWLCLPMSTRDDQVLTFLRAGEYPKLTRYDGFSSGLFAGDQEAVNAAIKEVLDKTESKDSRAVVDIATFDVEKTPSSLAFYDATTISQQYNQVADHLTKNKAEALGWLAELITSHLHLTFLNHFLHGFAVLTPYPSKSHLLTHTAYSLAKALRTCPSSPISSACPPNEPKCKPCSSDTAPPILTPDVYTNASSIYFIGTLPHPYTFASLLSKTKDLTTRHIRRDTDRDRWLEQVTKLSLGKDIGGPSRLVGFKGSVAGEKGAARGFWMIDTPPPCRKDLEYHFGFTLPAFNVSEETLPPMLEGPIDHEPSKREKKAREKDLQLQKDLIEAAKEVVDQKKKRKEKGGVKEMVEAWNLADTEGWRFVRAYRARERVQRDKWEQEERRFAGGEAIEGGWRWFDRRRGAP